MIKMLTSTGPKKGSRPQGGFTLIELLVVMAIISVLSSMLFPVYSEARGKARQIQCASNLRQIGMAIFMYSDDYDGLFPLCKNWGQAWGDTEWDARTDNAWLPQLLYSYVKTDKLFVCNTAQGLPGKEFDGKWYNSSTNGECCYYWNHIYASGLGDDFNSSSGRISGRMSTHVKDPSSAPVVWDLTCFEQTDKTHSNGINIVYADWHVKWQKLPFEDDYWITHSGDGWD